MTENTASVPQIAKEAVLMKSVELPSHTPIVKGYDFNDGINYDQLLASYVHSGFQATNFGKAVDEINKMVVICIHMHNITNTRINSLKLEINVSCCFDYFISRN